MENTELIRMMDIILIGPITILYSFTLKPMKIKIIILTIGILTIIYNLINLIRINYHKDIIPENAITKLFFDKKEGKTQLLRKINLLLMYPLLIYSYKFIKILQPKIQQTMKIFIITGIIYNTYWLKEINKKG